jgi:hypothetical protein
MGGSHGDIKIYVEMPHDPRWVLDLVKWYFSRVKLERKKILFWQYLCLCTRGHLVHTISCRLLTEWWCLVDLLSEFVF